MKKYKCIKPFWVRDENAYENGIENETEIKAGGIYESDEPRPTHFGESIRLGSTNGLFWIEIGSETFSECFEEMKGGAE